MSSVQPYHLSFLEWSEVWFYPFCHLTSCQLMCSQCFLLTCDQVFYLFGNWWKLCIFRASWDCQWGFTMHQLKRGMCPICMSLIIIVTFSPYFTFTPLYFHYDYLIPLFQGHMAIHAAFILTHFCTYDSSFLLLTYDSYRLWLIF